MSFLEDGCWAQRLSPDRACPARYLAVNSVWIAVARILWGFDISVAVDQRTGQPYNVNPHRLPWVVGVNVCVFSSRISDSHRLFFPYDFYAQGAGAAPFEVRAALKGVRIQNSGRMGKYHQCGLGLEL